VSEFEAKLTDAKARRILGRLAGFVSGGKYTGPGGPEGRQAFEATMRVVGVQALEDVRDEFDRESNYGGAWPELSVPTVVLRRGGPKLFGEADVEAKRATIKKLRDTNLLYLSLTPGATGNVLEVIGQGVRVGTRLERGRVHNRGGRSRFEFGEEEERRFERNVSAVKQGRRRPPPRKDGKRRQWKRAGKESPWNPWFFALRGALRTMHGKRYKVPKRRFLYKGALNVRRLAGIVIRRLGGMVS